MRPPSPVLPALAALLFLSGCGEPAAAEGAPTPLPAAPVTPVQLGPLPTPPLNAGDGWHTDFRRAFQHGLVIERPDETLHIEVLPLGHLEQEEEGLLYAGDPLAPETDCALPLRARPGRFAVELSRVRIRPRDGSADAVQVAACRLRLREGRASTWRWAGSFGAPHGLVAWISHSAQERVLAPDGAEGRRVRDRLVRPASAHGILATRAEDAAIDLVWCQTGLTDDSFDLYVGLDADGLPIEAVIDLHVLQEPIETIVPIEAPLEEPPGILHLPELEALGITVRRAHPGEVVAATGAPLWFEIDARENRRDPRLGFPEVMAVDDREDEVALNAGNEGFVIWVALPMEGSRAPARLFVAVRTGMRAI